MSTDIEGGGGGGNNRVDEESPLLNSSFAIFNDLTYSDDETDDDDGDMGGISGSFSSENKDCTSSPDTAKLLDEIQANAASIPLQQTNTTSESSSLLMHPLARNQSINSVETTGDEGTLAYSISSTLADEIGSTASTHRQPLGSPPPPALQQQNSSYGATLDSRFDNFMSNSPAAAVLFRPPTSVFDHSSSNNSSSKGWVYPKPTASSGRTQTEPMMGSSSIPQSYGRHGSNGSSSEGSNNRSIPITPQPFIAHDSPVTSATATDSTSVYEISPLTKEAASPEKERITRILSEEANQKKIRRHRRLRRIKKAAEAREAAVQKVRGIEQSTRCNDATFAFIFLCQFLLVCMSALAFGPGALRDKIYGSFTHHRGEYWEDDDTPSVIDVDPFEGLHTDDVVIIDNPLYNSKGSGSGVTDLADVQEQVVEAVDGISHIDYINVIQLVCIASGYASMCSLLGLGFMMMLSKNLIHVTLIFTIIISVTWTLLGLAFSSYWAVPIAGSVAVLLSSAYTVVVWDRITFAATNISVALKGMRSSLDILFVGLCVLGLTYLWTILWICAFIGTFDFLNDDEELSNNWMSVIIVFFLFSYYWTFQVIKGISQTTVASIIGKWWDHSEDDPLPICSPLSRNIIGSFGSICLGSLIVDPCVLVARLSNFNRLARPKLRQLKASAIDNTKLRVKQTPANENCECVPSNTCSGALSRNINQWSYAYIGLYGYKFWEAGSKASLLFEARGWTHVVSEDDLILTVLSMSSMIVGGSTACLALIIEEVDGYSLTSLNKPIKTAFFIGACIGYFLSSAFLSIVKGSVSAILVCYAASPVQFHANHHQLSQEMKAVWKHLWLQNPKPSQDRSTGER